MERARLGPWFLSVQAKQKIGAEYRQQASPSIFIKETTTSLLQLITECKEIKKKATRTQRIHPTSCQHQFSTQDQQQNETKVLSHLRSCPKPLSSWLFILTRLTMFWRHPPLAYPSNVYMLMFSTVSY
jgi:hypothetical protein